MPIQRLNHAVLYVRDVDASVAFYTEALGFRIKAALPGAAFLQAEGWARVGALAVDTVVMSVIATGLAGLGAVATIAAASRSLTVGEFGPGGGVGCTVHLLARGLPLLAVAHRRV